MYVIRHYPVEKFVILVAEEYVVATGLIYIILNIPDGPAIFLVIY